MALNNFLPFCPTDTGTNLESQATYAAASDRTSGNQPGVAKSALVNKALRQGTYVSGQLAQFLADTTGTDLLDDATPAKLLSQIKAALAFYPPVYTKYTSSSGTHNPTYYFQIASGNATTGATYTNNSITFTVKATIASGLLLTATGAGAPLVSGTLTKTGGTGDATLTFYSVRAPQVMQLKLIGGGAGGAGSGSSGAGTGGAGGTTSFGTSLLTCTGGAGGVPDGTNSPAGGTATINAPAVGLGFTGASGGAISRSGIAWILGGPGGATTFGGAGNTAITGGNSGQANTGSGGSGAGASNNAVSVGQGGAAGALIEALIYAPFTTYPYAVGAGGTIGAAGSSGASGGAGGSGVIEVLEVYQ